jgi:hypothetical protein
VEAQPLKLRKLFEEYGSFPDALLSTYASTYGGEDPRLALYTIWPSVSIVLICMYNFLIIVILLNMIITLMGDLYKKIKDKQEVVFLKNRAGKNELCILCSVPTWNMRLKKNKVL